MVELDISIIFAGLSIAASVVYYASVLQNANKARDRELIYQKFQSISIEYIKTFNEVMTMKDWKHAEEWEEKYGQENNLEAFSKWNYVMLLYQLAGLLLIQGADPDLIFELYPAGAVIELFELYEPVFEYMTSKKSWNLDNLYYLYNEAKKRRPEVGQ